MTNEILSSIDQIQNEKFYAEFDVLDALYEMYHKAFQLESFCENVMISDIFQESVFMEDGEGFFVKIKNWIDKSFNSISNWFKKLFSKKSDKPKPEAIQNLESLVKQHGGKFLFTAAGITGVVFVAKIVNGKLQVSKVKVKEDATLPTPPHRMRI